MISTAKLSSKAQITIPKSVRQAMDLRQGDILEFCQTEPGRFLIKRKEAAGSAWGFLNDKISKGGHPPSVEEMNEAVAEAINEEFWKGLN